MIQTTNRTGPLVNTNALSSPQTLADAFTRLANQTPNEVNETLITDLRSLTSHLNTKEPLAVALHRQIDSYHLDPNSENIQAIAGVLLSFPDSTLAAIRASLGLSAIETVDISLERGGAFIQSEDEGAGIDEILHEILNGGSLDEVTFIQPLDAETILKKIQEKVPNLDSTLWFGIARILGRIVEFDHDFEEVITVNYDAIMEAFEDIALTKLDKCDYPQFINSNRYLLVNHYDALIELMASELPSRMTEEQTLWVLTQVLDRLRDTMLFTEILDRQEHPLSQEGLMLLAGEVFDYFDPSGENSRSNDDYDPLAFMFALDSLFLNLDTSNRIIIFSKWVDRLAYFRNFPKMLSEEIDKLSRIILKHGEFSAIEFSELSFSKVECTEDELSAFLEILSRASEETIKEPAVQELMNNIREEIKALTTE